MREFLGFIFYIAFFIALMAIFIFYFYTGAAGLSIQFDLGWAVAASIAAMFRFALPLSIGSFFYATNVWGWGNLGALVFAFPFVGFQLLLLTGYNFEIVANRFQRN